MNDNEYLAGIILEQLGRGSPVVTASIVSLQGSSPRHRGTKMVIGENGKSYGTIGGSLLEATSIQEAKTILEQKRAKFMHFDLMGNGVNSKGMICGGKAIVLLDYVSPTKENLEFFKTWHEAVLSARDFYLLTYIKNHTNFVDILGRSLLYADGKISGSSLLSPAEIEYLRTELHNISMTSIINMRDLQVVVDPIRKLKTLYILGAGHVAVPTAMIAAMTGFRVVVIDDRPEFASTERFPEAYEVRVIDSFDKAYEGLEIDSDSFIVIVTRGHQFDRVVLEQALKTNAGYIGMISSRRKRESIYAALLAKGITQEALEKVHSPIGINIGGETPEEIAVSIIAELISERSKQQNTQ